MADLDVEFQDEWEEVPFNAAAAEDSGDILISLTDASVFESSGKRSKAGAGRTYTKQEREDALQVHRAHTLCLLARALLHDQAAASSELQALMVSLLPDKLFDAATKAATSEDSSAAAWLPELMRWFHRTFKLTSHKNSTSAAKHEKSTTTAAATGSKATTAGGGPSHHDVLSDLGLISGSGLSLTVQLLQCVDNRCGSSAQLVSLLVATLRGVGLLTRSVWSLDPLPFKPAAVEALARGSRLRAKTPAAAAAAASGGGGGGGKSGKPAGRPKAAAAGRKRSMTPAVDSQAAANAISSKSRKRSKSADKQQDDGVEGPTDAAAEQEAQLQQQRKRKGDEEFELQLAMAMASTAAAAESRAAAAAAGQGSSIPETHSAAAASIPPSPSQQPAKGTTAQDVAPKSVGSSPAKSLASLIDKGVSPAALRAAAAAAAPPQGFLWQPQPSFVPVVWCEVYVGSSAAGRWCHVDVLQGCYNQPGVVEGATARSVPLSYVVACQAGAPKDVTRRYAANFTLTLKWRDEGWWSSTLNALRSTAAHLPRHLAQQMNTAAAAAAAAEVPQVAGPSNKQQQQQQSAFSNAAGTAAAPDYSQIDHDSSSAAAAALRAAREDAELSHRADSHAAAPPTTIEGFKAHPLYVLHRHITKYQALAPGATKLGTHRGEAFYSRQDLHDLHTAERWRREGRQVREEQMHTPAKEIKKRALPAAAGSGRLDRAGSSSSSGRFAGGWGPWQRSSSSNSTRKDSVAAADGSKQPPTAAAAGQDVNAAEGEVTGDTVKLYGYWQTDPWVPPAAVDGKVPKNERGNVEVPPFAKALPAGTVHVCLPGLVPVCRALGVDYAPALTGFDVQGGRMVPRIEGVVVCQEFEQDVVQLYLQREQDKAAAEEQRLKQEAAKAWRTLLNSMWTRLQLQRRYGTAAAAAEGGSKSVLVGGAQALLQQEQQAAAGKAKDIIHSLHQSQQQPAATHSKEQQPDQRNVRSRNQRQQLPGGVDDKNSSVVIDVKSHNEQKRPMTDGAEQLQQDGVMEGVEVEEF